MSETPQKKPNIPSALKSLFAPIATLLVATFGKNSLLREMPRRLPEQLLSDDPPTRNVTLAWLSLALAVLALISWASFVTVKNWRQQRAIQFEEATKAQRLIQEREEQEKNRLARTLPLGQFTLMLHPVEATARKNVLNIAKFKLTAVFDEIDTKLFAEENIVVLRSEITESLPLFDREDIMSRDGKTNLKSLILKRTNTWLPHGKLLDLYLIDLNIH